MISNQIGFFLITSCLVGFAGACSDAVFNNYLNESFTITNLQRTIIELPRETPGLIVIFVSALFSFLCVRRLAALSMLFAAIGTLLLAIATPNFQIMLFWLFIMSAGQHIFIPTSSAIGMELAKEGETGKRLGQFNGARNFAAILGSLSIFLGFKYFHFSFSISFLIASAGYFTACIFLLKMKPAEKQKARLQLKFHKEYKLYYWLSILFGARKQIFFTFAPWVLVTVFHQPTTMVAKLLTIGGTIGIVFQPLVGRCIDKIGERIILTSEAFILIFVCLGYGFAKTFFDMKIAFIIAASCYVLDQLLMSVGMARATYLKKIAVTPSHVTPTLTMATSIDHIFSIAVALLGGLLWKFFGYQSVFFLGALIAVVNLFSALKVTIPTKDRLISEANSQIPTHMTQGIDNSTKPQEILKK